MVKKPRRFNKNRPFYDTCMTEVMKVFNTFGYPLTERQIFYQLVSIGFLRNCKSDSNSLSKDCLCKARRKGDLDPEWIIDDSREIRKEEIWIDDKEFFKDSRNHIDNLYLSYNRNLWQTQPQFVMVYLEKEALSRIFQRVVRPYQCPLIIARGFGSDSQIYEMSKVSYEMTKDFEGSGLTWIQVYTDRDPSGRDIYHSLRTRLGFYFKNPFKVELCALSKQQIHKYNLLKQPKYLKKKKKTIQIVELDAFKPSDLEQIIRDNIEKRILDKNAWITENTTEKQETQSLGNFFSGRTKKWKYP
jgi:hypothetical protein